MKAKWVLSTVFQLIKTGDTLEFLGYLHLYENKEIGLENMVFLSKVLANLQAGARVLVLEKNMHKNKHDSQFVLKVLVQGSELMGWCYLYRSSDVKIIKTKKLTKRNPKNSRKA